MKTNLGGCIFNLTKYVLFFFIILVQSCTSTSAIRLEGNDFEKNLPGLWEGKWSYGSGRTDVYNLEFIKIDGNNVHLTGFFGGGGSGQDSTKVYGRIENSTLLLTWPDALDGPCQDESRMIRDESNKLLLVGEVKCGGWSARVRLMKTE